MKIILTTRFDSDYCQSQQMYIDDKQVWKARDLAQDCPEDATLSRDMTNGNEIIELMKVAYEAGKQGDELSVEFEEVANED